MIDVTVEQNAQVEALMPLNTGVELYAGPVSLRLKVRGETTGQIIDRLERFQADLNNAVDTTLQAIEEYDPE